MIVLVRASKQNVLNMNLKMNLKQSENDSSASKQYDTGSDATGAIPREAATDQFIYFSPELMFWHGHSPVVKQHGIIVVTIRSDTSNGIRGRKDKSIIGCERGGNYKRKNVYEGSYSMKVKCPLMLRSVSSGGGWKVTVRCGFHNHILAKDLDGHDVLGRLKDNERKPVNDMTKYNMAPRYLTDALKDRDPENLTSVTQLYKARFTYKISKRGPFTEMQHQLSLLH
ncbi:uncharacterized protein LOC131615116 [Vicia villosa]|uniref:uncharacterized protein LOC131615116 n=1 Tax=Vicia villosa TaxID=3911 RepID=UPI00273B589C|nr:uncharacterized protein LOC131615116 [Vicia villosa]